MGYAVMASLVLGLLMMNRVSSQDACTTAQLALASNSVCLQELQSVDGITDLINSSLCMEPCYSLISDAVNNCEEFVSYIASYLMSKVKYYN